VEKLKDEGYGEYLALFQPPQTQTQQQQSAQQQPQAQKPSGTK
jgi:hypothetical protein